MQTTPLVDQLITSPFDINKFFKDFNGVEEKYILVFKKCVEGSLITLEEVLGYTNMYVDTFNNTSISNASILYTMKTLNTNIKKARHFINLKNLEEDFI